MIPKLLFVLNGLGLGNSTRCHAVIQRLHRSGAEIEIVTSGNGLWYFQDKSEVSRIHTIESLQYGKKSGELSMGRTLLSAGASIVTVRRNNKTIRSLFETVQPHVVVTDSEYGVMSAKRLGIPIVALNNSDVVCGLARRFEDIPFSVLPQLYGIEFMDYLYHSLIPDFVVSPTLGLTAGSKNPKFRHIGPIVRMDFAPLPPRDAPRKVVVMLSGSTFGTQVRLRRSYAGVNIDVIGRSKPDGLDQSEIRYHGKILDSRSILADADLVVVNGGFSAVSEVFWMRKPMIVVPVPNHAEQWINARTIVHHGVGKMSDDVNLEDNIEDALHRWPDFLNAYSALPPMADGAEEAADIIHDVARNGTSTKAT